MEIGTFGVFLNDFAKGGCANLASLNEGQSSAPLRKSRRTQAPTRVQARFGYWVRWSDQKAMLKMRLDLKSNASHSPIFAPSNVVFTGQSRRPLVSRHSISEAKIFEASHDVELNDLAFHLKTPRRFNKSGPQFLTILIPNCEFTFGGQ